MYVKISMKAPLGLKSMEIFCEILKSVHIQKYISNWKMNAASVQVDPVRKQSGLQKRAMIEHERVASDIGIWWC